MESHSSSPFLHRPGTQLGRWAASLLVVFVILFMVNALVFVPAARGEPSAKGTQATLPNFLYLC